MAIVKFDLRVLGTLRLLDAAGEPVESILAQSKRAGLLCYLAAGPPRRATNRDTLLALFWPESAEEPARNALNQALHFLRRVLGDEVIVGAGASNLLVDRTFLHCDAVEFEALLDAGRDEDAVALYQGPFLSGFNVSKAPDFAQWIDEERARLSARYAQALERLAIRAQASGELDNAIARWRQAAAVDPLDTHVNAGLIRSLARAGQRAQAIRQGEVHARLLRDHLDLDPDPEIVALAEELRSEKGPPRTPASGPTALNSAATSPKDQSVIQPTARQRWRPLPWSAAAGGAVILALIGWSIVHARGEREIASDRVLVAAFENRTGDTAFKDLGGLTADYIADGLLRSGVVQVVDPATAFYALHDPHTRKLNLSAREDMRTIARSVHAGTIVWGTIYATPDSLIYEARVSDVPSARLLGTVRVVQASGNRQTAAVEEVRERVGGLIASRFDVRLTSLGSEQLPPPRLEAYQEYAKGLSHFQRGEYSEALNEFLSASKLDSTFFLPHSWSIYAAGNGGAPPRVRDSLVEALMLKRGRLSPLDRLALDSHYWAGKDIAKQRQAVGQAARLAPGSNWSYMQGMLENRAFNPRAAVHHLELTDRERGWARGWTIVERELGWALHMVGDYKRELAVAREGISRAIADARPADVPMLQQIEVRALAGLGDTSAIRKLIPQYEATSRQSRASAPLLAGAIALFYHGYADLGRELLSRDEAALDYVNSTGDTAVVATYWMRKAGNAYYRWDLPEMKRRVTLQLKRDSANNRPVSNSALQLLAVAAATEGRMDEAERYIQMARELGPNGRTSALLIEAAVAGVRGDANKAATLLRQFAGEGRMGNPVLVMMDPALRSIKHSPALRLLFRGENPDD